MDADQVIYGTYRVDPSSGMLSVDATVSDRAQARLADLAEENGVLTNLDRVEAHLAWQALSVIAPAAAPAEDAFQTLRPAVRVNASENLGAGGATWMPTLKVREFTFSSLSDAV